MAARKRANSPWKPALWQRMYRGSGIWVEEVYTNAPTWEWNCSDLLDGGRAKTRAAAMRAAEKAVDAMLEGQA